MKNPAGKIAEHYGISDLYGRIISALALAGIPEDRLTSDDVAPIDEFHIGGRSATRALLDPIGLDETRRVLDIGSGLGGAARYIAERYGAAVTGIDLTPEFVATARQLSETLKIDVTFVEGSALDLPFAPESFDVATLFHVGMNLPDKNRLFENVARVLSPGGKFAVYDVMLLGQTPAFPLPWASTPDESFLETPDVYVEAATRAGFRLTARRGRRDVAESFFAAMARHSAEGTGPAVDVTMLMGENWTEKRQNMADAIASGDIEPTEMIFEKG